jgi:GNAT superfamily N-acetyltransferase
MGAGSEQPETRQNERSRFVSRVSTGEPEPRIEFFRDGDEHELAAFDRRRGGPASTPEYWRWKYFDNPAGPACVAAAWVGDEIVGTLGFLPVRTRVHAREVIATQQVDVAIHPAHRGGGLYFRLANAVMEEAARRGIAFGFGFATEETRALSVDFLGFDHVAPVHRLTKVLDYGHYASGLLGRRIARMLRPVAARARGWKSRRRAPVARNVARIDRFDHRADRLAETLTLGRIMVIRDAAYLNWRYADCPTVRYGRYAAGTQAAVSGFVVFHTYEADGHVRGIVDELVSSPDDPDTVNGLLAAALSDLAADGAVNASCWLPAWHPHVTRLRALGFREREARNHLIVVPNRAPGLELGDLTEDRSWYYTHGDSDYHMRSA